MTKAGGGAIGGRWVRLASCSWRSRSTSAAPLFTFVILGRSRPKVVAQTRGSMPRPVSKGGTTMKDGGVRGTSCTVSPAGGGEAWIPDTRGLAPLDVAFRDDEGGGRRDRRALGPTCVLLVAVAVHLRGAPFHLRHPRAEQAEGRRADPRIHASADVDRRDDDERRQRPRSFGEGTCSGAARHGSRIRAVSLRSTSRSGMTKAGGGAIGGRWVRLASCSWRSRSTFAAPLSPSSSSGGAGRRPSTPRSGMTKAGGGADVAHPGRSRSSAAGGGPVSAASRMPAQKTGG